MKEHYIFENIKKQIGGNIKKIRLENNLEIKKVCADLEISLAAYGNIERGLTDICISRIIQISNYFNVHLSTILAMDNFENYTTYNSKINDIKSTEGFIIAIEELKKEIEYLRIQNDYLIKKKSK